MVVNKPFPHLLVLGVMLLSLPFVFGQEKPLPKGSVAGRVTSEKGEPLTGVKVMLENGGEVETDKDGAYLAMTRFC